VSGAALLLRFVDVAEDFADLDPRPVVFDPPAVVRLWGDDVAPETLSLGPAVTAGIVDEAAAVVSAVDLAEDRHPAIVAATSIIETFEIGVIICVGLGYPRPLPSAGLAGGVGAVVPIHPAWEWQ